jgi:hypothetical protein
VRRGGHPLLWDFYKELTAIAGPAMTGEGHLFMRDITQQVSPSPHLKMETDPVSEI